MLPTQPANQKAPHKTGVRMHLLVDLLEDRHRGGRFLVLASSQVQEGRHRTATTHQAPLAALAAAAASAGGCVQDVVVIVVVVEALGGREAGDRQEQPRQLQKVKDGVGGGDQLAGNSQEAPKGRRQKERGNF